MKDKLSINIGKRLMEIRKQLNYTQQEVADNIEGLTVQMISSYETGKSKPCIENLMKFCDFYNISLDYICCGKIQSQKGNYNIKTYDELFRILLALIDNNFFEYYNYSFDNHTLAYLNSNDQNIVSFFNSLDNIAKTKKDVSEETYKKCIDDLLSKFSSKEIK